MQNRKEKYTYITHPDNLPLQLSGNSKKHAQILKKEDFKQKKCTLNQQCKSFLINKLTNNVHQFGKNKSVLPEPDPRRKRRTSSIKTFNNEKLMIRSSGIQYLLQKADCNKPTHLKEKSHIHQPTRNETKMSEKKHFISQLKNKQSEQIKPQIHHRQTTLVKLNQDIYSNAYRIQRQIHPTKKLQINNYFKRGLELGYDIVKKKQVSESKMIQIMGSQHVRSDKPEIQINKIQDWRKSNIF